MSPAVLLALGLFACQTSGQQSKGTGSEGVGTARVAEMPASTYLPAKAREKIRANMKAHGDDMTVLMWSIIFLDVDGAAEFAKVIKNQQWLERPADPAAVPADEKVPEAIYAYQDEIVQRANVLGAIAEQVNKHEAAKLADAFGAVARTCVACHAAYLYEDASQPSATLPADL